MPSASASTSAGRRCRSTSRAATIPTTPSASFAGQRRARPRAISSSARASASTAIRACSSCRSELARFELPASARPSAGLSLSSSRTPTDASSRCPGGGARGPSLKPTSPAPTSAPSCATLLERQQARAAWSASNSSRPGASAPGWARRAGPRRPPCRARPRSSALAETSARGDGEPALPRAAACAAPSRGGTRRRPRRAGARGNCSPAGAGRGSPSRVASPRQVETPCGDPPSPPRRGQPRSAVDSSATAVTPQSAETSSLVPFAASFSSALRLRPSLRRAAALCSPGSPLALALRDAGAHRRSGAASRPGSTVWSRRPHRGRRTPWLARSRARWMRATAASMPSRANASRSCASCGERKRAQLPASRRPRPHRVCAVAGAHCSSAARRAMAVGASASDSTCSIQRMRALVARRRDARSRDCRRAPTRREGPGECSDARTGAPYGAPATAARQEQHQQRGAGGAHPGARAQAGGRVGKDHAVLPGGDRARAQGAIGVQHGKLRTPSTNARQPGSASPEITSTDGAGALHAHGEDLVPERSRSARFQTWQAMQ